MTQRAEQVEQETLQNIAKLLSETRSLRAQVKSTAEEPRADSPGRAETVTHLRNAHRHLDDAAIALQAAGAIARLDEAARERAKGAEAKAGEEHPLPEGS